MTSGNTIRILGQPQQENRVNTKRIAVKLAAKYGRTEAKRKVWGRIRRIPLGLPTARDAHRWLVWVGVGTAIDRLGGADA